MHIEFEHKIDILIEHIIPYLDLKILQKLKTMYLPLICVGHNSSKLMRIIIQLLWKP